MSAPPPPAGRWAAWVALLDRREPGTSLALFRVACGLIVVGAVGSVLWHGLLPALWFDQADGGQLAMVERPWLFRLIGGVTPASVRGMAAVAMVSGALLAPGLGGRLTAFVALQSYMALTNLNGFASGGDDRLLRNALWLLVLARSTATLSLDCRLRTGRWTSDEPVPAWPRYLVIAQLVIVYAASGWQKLSEDWLPGGDMSALYYILQAPSWQRFDMTWLAGVYPLTQAATAVTWFFEAGAPLLLLALWYRHTADRPGRLRALFNRVPYRGLFVLVGVGLHLGVLVLMNVEPFSLVSLSFYLCLIRPDEWRALWGRLSGLPLQTNGRHSCSPQGWWPHARAALVTLHLVAVVALALPGPPYAALDESSWRTEAVQRELGVWCRRLDRAGVETTPVELEETVRGIARRWLEVRDALLWPFRPYYELCGTYQSWKMFTGAPRVAGRLCVDVEEGGRWRPVYLERDPELTWLDDKLSHHRVRPALMSFASGLYPDDYRAFAVWLAAQAARDFPGAGRVRVRYLHSRIPTPEEARAGARPPAEHDREIVLPLRRADDRATTPAAPGVP